MKKYLLFCIIVLLLVGIGSAAPTGYNYYKSLHINGSSAWAADLTYYQIEYTIHRSSGTDSGNNLYVGTNCQSDYDDIYFTDSSGNPIDYYREPDYTSSIGYFVVEVPTISKTTGADIRMYYCKSTATTSSNADNTFVFFDTFDGSSLDPTKWISVGAISVGSSSLFIDSDASIRSISTFGNNYKLVFDSYTTGYNKYGYYVPDNGFYDGSYAGEWSYINYNPVTSNYVLTDSSLFTIIRNSSKTYLLKDSLYYISIGTATASEASIYIDAGYGAYCNEIRVYKSADVQPEYSTVSTTSLVVAANFAADKTTVYEYQTVTFTDSSTGSPDAWNWSFGSGEGYSSDQNPTHQYTTPGTYKVVLNATNTTNVLTDTETKLNYITVLCSPVVAQFTSNVTNGAAPLDVAFTSTSTNATAWEWDFDSDGDIDSTDENPNWTYPSVGFWSPTLVVYGNGTCEDDEVKEDYIYVSMTGTGDTGNLSQGYGYQYPPKDVRFKVMTMFGEPIDGCSVIAQGITTTTGTWDWLIQLFGVSLNETPIMNANMAGTTDSNGEIVFLMIPSVKYNMTFYRAGEINQLFYITPKDEYYNIYSTTGGESYYEHGYDYNAIINITLSTTDFGASDDYITVTYVDSLSQTTDADIYIYETSTSGETLVNSTSLTPGGSFTQSLLVEDTPGHSYHIRVETTHTTFGSKTRDFTVIFPDTAPTTFGFPSELLIFFAIFILIFVGMLFGAASATAGSLIVCFVGWILYAIGWLNSLGATAPVALSAATAFSIFAIIAKAYREDR